MAARTILIVALHTPPSTSSGARRPAGLAKYLSRMGHRVIVLTSTFAGSGPVREAARTVRTRDLLTSRFNWRRGNVAALTGPGTAAAVAPPSPLELYAVPDLQVAAWVPFALPRALRLAREEAVDAVITTGPPHSVHLIGAALARRGAAWVADLRDGWTFEPSNPGFGGRSAATVAMERALLRRADAAVGISKPIADDLAQRCGARAVHIPLAYDPEEMADAVAAGRDSVKALLDPAKRSLVYTGSIVDADGASATFLRALQQIKARRGADLETLEVVVAGPVRTDVRARVDALGLGELVRFAGTLDRVQALALQRAADALLVLVAHGGSSILTNKVVEYLVAGRPILVVGEGSEAGRLVDERGAGLVAPRTDADAVAAMLERLLDGDVPTPPPGAGADLSFPAVAERVHGLIEAALERDGRSDRAGPPRRRHGLPRVA